MSSPQLEGTSLQRTRPMSSPHLFINSLAENAIFAAAVRHGIHQITLIIKPTRRSIPEAHPKELKSATVAMAPERSCAAVQMIAI